MNRGRSRRRRALAAALAATGSLFTLAVGGFPRGAGAAGEQHLLVFAAASTRDALEAVARLWQAQGHARVRFSFAASSALARQLEQGAPADLFVSADGDWMDYVRRQGLVRGDTVRPLLGNRLVLVAPAGDPAANLALRPGVDLAAALAGGRLAVADVRSVPAGRYARAALESLGAWPAVKSRLSMSENVRVALALVARGEAPLGIVYESDAHADPRVRVVDVFPADSHPPIRYPVAIMRASRNAEAQGFYDHLRSAAAAAAFRDHGFSPVS
jgi:molybdate transport system substrate-binding protein